MNICNRISVVATNYLKTQFPGKLDITVTKLKIQSAIIQIHRLECSVLRFINCQGEVLSLVCFV